MNTLQEAKVPVKDVIPKEGTTGWSDTWMISSNAKHPNCTYLWMNHIIYARGAGAAGESLRRGAGEHEGLRAHGHKGLLQEFHADGRGLLDRRLLLEDADADCGDDRGDDCMDHKPSGQQAWTEIKRIVDRRSPTASRRPRQGPGRRLSAAFLCRHPWLRLGALLAAPLGWLLVVYLGSLAVLLLAAFWQTRPVHDRGRAHVHARQLPHPVGARRLPADRLADDRDGGAGDRDRRRARVPDRLLHGADRVAARTRPLLFVSSLLPLWASYLVKVYAWRTDPGERGHPQLGARPVRAPGPELAYDDRASGSSSPISGCRS